MGRRGRAYRGGERDIILRVITYFELEKQRKGPILPIDRALDRASVATGVSVRTLRTIKNEAKLLKNAMNSAETPGTSAVTQDSFMDLSSDSCSSQCNPSTETKQRAKTPEINPRVVRLSTPKKKRKSGRRPPITDPDLIAIRNLVQNFYAKRKKVPTLKTVFLAARSKLNFPGQKTLFRKILREKLGCKFVKCKRKGQMIVTISQISDTDSSEEDERERVMAVGDLISLTDPKITITNPTSVIIAGPVL